MPEGRRFQEGREGDKRVEKIRKRKKLLFLYHFETFSAEKPSFLDDFLVVLRSTTTIGRLSYFRRKRSD
jgi:hypothetical protein